MLITSVLSALQHWLRYHETLRELSRLYDRVLNAVGIHRSDIADMA